MPTIYREGKLAGLNRAIGDVGEFAIQKQLLEQQRKRELQDAVKKAVITSVLSGKGKFKTPVDFNSMVSNDELPDLNQYEMKDEPLSSGQQRLGQLAETQRKLNILSGFEQPSEADITALPLQRHIFGQPKQLTIPGPAIDGVQGMITGMANEALEPATPEETAGLLREKWAQGIKQADINRKALGLPVFAGKAQGITKMKTVENTNKVMANISSQEDIQELIDNREEYETEGVDVDRILREWEAENGA